MWFQGLHFISSSQFYIGHTCRELFHLRTGKCGRTVDVVVWPSCHDDVRHIVEAACRHNVCVIPFGGTNCRIINFICSCMWQLTQVMIIFVGFITLFWGRGERSITLSEGESQKIALLREFYAFIGSEIHLGYLMNSCVVWIHPLCMQKSEIT